MISHVHSYLMFAVVSKIKRKTRQTHLYRVVADADAGHRYIEGEILVPVSVAI